VEVREQKWCTSGKVGEKEGAGILEVGLGIGSRERLMREAFAAKHSVGIAWAFELLAGLPEDFSVRRGKGKPQKHGGL